jgi:hypothetical protein
MSATTESIVKKLVVVAALAGLGSALAFLLVACGGKTAAPSHPRPAAWQALPPAPIKARGLADLTSVWTGKELIVSAVKPGSDGTFIKSTDVAAAYDPATRTWRRLPAAPKMDDHCRRDAVWTGTEVLLWGCRQAAFDPHRNAWRMLPKAPTGEGFVAWTGHELIGWGGGCCGDVWRGGSAYDPAGNSWRTLSQPPLAPSQRPLGAWTGHKLILVVSGFTPEGGYSTQDKAYPARFARAAAYDPETDSWRRLASPPRQALRYGGVAAWDGHELLVVGNATATAQMALAYRPATNRWRRLARPPRNLIPVGASWTGSRLLVLGGGEALRAYSYDPKANRWTSLPRVPVQSSDQSVAWTGSRLIFWGSAGGAVFTPASG